MRRNRILLKIVLLRLLQLGLLLVLKQKRGDRVKHVFVFLRIRDPKDL